MAASITDIPFLALIIVEDFVFLQILYTRSIILSHNGSLFKDKSIRLTNKIGQQTQNAPILSEIICN
jgi:hypothetical protein